MMSAQFHSCESSFHKVWVTAMLFELFRDAGILAAQVIYLAERRG